MDFAPIWRAHLDARDAFAAAFAPRWQHAITEAGLTGTPWYLLDIAAMFAPDPFTLAHLEALGPYTTHERRTHQLALAIHHGLLLPVTDHGYQATSTGRRARLAMIAIIHTGLATHTPLPYRELENIVESLERLSTASMQAARPPTKVCLPCHRRLYPGNGAPALARFLHYSTDLNAYRDDAHMAAWRPYGVSGLCWDAVTVLWREGNAGLDQLAQDHKQSRAVYTDILRPAIAQGWVAIDHDTYRLTEQGQAIRQAAEKATDRTFFTPWACLTESETNLLHQRLIQLRDGLHHQTPAA
jgi:hypothetical protein